MKTALQVYVLQIRVFVSVTLANVTQGKTDDELLNGPSRTSQPVLTTSQNNWTHLTLSSLRSPATVTHQSLVSL